MKRLARKRIRRWFTLVLVLAILAIGGGVILAKRALEPEAIVFRIEEEFNCRASIGEVKANLFSSPARLEITRFAMGIRDDAARSKLSLKEREALVDPPVQAETLVLEVSLDGLLRGKLEVQELSATGAKLHIIREDNGDTNLDLLFDDPDLSKHRERDAKKKSDRSASEDDPPVFNVDNVPLPTYFTEASIRDAQVTFEMPKRKTKITGTELNLLITNIVIDKRDLVGKNHADLELNGTLSIDAMESDLHYATLLLSGEGDIIPFDRSSRDLLPEVTCRLDLLQGSQFATVPVIDAISRKLGELEDYGIDLSRLQLNGDLVKESLIDLHYFDRKYTLASDSSLELNDFKLNLAKSGWYESRENEHHLVGQVLLSEEITEHALSEVDRFVEKNLKMLSTKSFHRLLIDNFITNDRLAVRVVSTGDLGKPKVDFLNQLPDLSALIKDATRELLSDPDKLIDGLRSLFD